MRAIPKPDPKLDSILRAPDTRIYVVDVSFGVLKDPVERDYLNGLPTSFVLPDGAVDRLRAAARAVILETPEVQRLMKQGAVRMVGAAARKALDSP